MATAMLALNRYPTRSPRPGVTDRPIVLVGSLGSARSMWRPQRTALTGLGPVIEVDLRGHGDSQVLDVPATMSDLAGDVLAALDLIHVHKAHFVGLSLGGAICQQIALDHPERVDHLVLSSTAARFGTPEAWAEKIALVSEKGTPALADAVLANWFTADWARRNRAVIAQIRDDFERTSPVGYTRACGALAEFDSRTELGRIAAPTLVVSATEDGSTPPEVVQVLADAVPGARLRTIEDAAHLVNIERSAEFNDALTGFLGAA